MAALSLKFGWLGYPLDNAYLNSCIQAIYKGKGAPDLEGSGTAETVES